MAGAKRRRPPWIPSVPGYRWVPVYRGRELVGFEERRARKTAAERRRLAWERASRPLTPSEIRQMLASGPIHPSTWARAMGSKQPPPHFNPQRKGARAMAKAKRKAIHPGDRKGPKRRPDAAYAAAAAKWFHEGKSGPVAKSKADARVRHQIAQIWQASYKQQQAKAKKKSRAWAKKMAGMTGGGHKAAGKKKKGGHKKGHHKAAAARKKSAAAAARKRSAAATGAAAAATTTKAAARKAKGGKKAKARRSHLLKRMPSKRQLRRFVRSLPRKASLTVFRDLKRSSRLRTRTYRNPRGGDEMATYSNPRRRRHNPAGLGGAARSVAQAAIPAAVGGFAAGFMDAKVTGHMPLLVRVGAKVAAAAAGGYALRHNPTRAAAFIGSMVGTATYEPGLRLGGGVLATSKPAGMKELAAMAAEDEQAMGALQQELRGYGLLKDDGMGDGPDLGEDPDLGEEFEEIADGDYE